MTTKDKVLEDDLKKTLLARVVPSLPVDETRGIVRDKINSFEFDYYFKEREKLVREECEKEITEHQKKRLYWENSTHELETKLDRIKKALDNITHVKGKKDPKDTLYMGDYLAFYNLYFIKAALF